MAYCLLIATTFFEVYLISKMLSEWAVYINLDDNGIRENGIVSRCYYRNYYTRYIHKVYYVKFRIQINGIACEIEQQVNSKTYFTLVPGDSVSVAYLENNPQTARLWNDNADKTQQIKNIENALSFGVVLVAVLYLIFKS